MVITYEMRICTEFVGDSMLRTIDSSVMCVCTLPLQPMLKAPHAKQ